MVQARFGSKGTAAATRPGSPRTLFIVFTLLLVFGAFAVAAPVHAAAAAGEAKPAPSAAAPLDINQATADELTALPGIGPAMAKRIVEFREEHGPFRRVEDLMRVKGIGEKSFEKLRPSVKVSRSR